jgi:hypothetical protein
MNDKGGSVLLWLITIALIVFTATRSVNLIQSTMPADSQMVAYAALAGLDGGVLAWLFWTTRSAKGGVQRTIGSLMIVVDLAGIAAAVLGDTMLIAGTDPQMVGMVSIWVIPIIIIANIAATVVAHMFDPSQSLRDAQRSVSDELERQKAEWMKANASSIASQVGPAAGAHAAQQMLAQFQAASHGQNGHVPATPQTFNTEAPDIQAVPKSHRRKTAD